MKQLVVIPEEGEIVSRMFQWAAAQVSPSTVASYANALGWRTRNKNPWTARQVLFTLANYVYAGLVVDGWEFRDGCHKALVERSIFDEVQNSLALRRTRQPGRGRTIPWLLRGLVRCGGCGRVLSTHTVQHGSIIFCYYRCRSTAGGRDPCKGVLVSAGEIDHAVLEAAGVKEKWLTSKEQEAAVRGVIRQIVYKADTQRIEIEFQPGAAIGERLADEVLSKV